MAALDKIFDNVTPEFFFHGIPSFLCGPVPRAARAGPCVYNSPARMAGRQDRPVCGPLVLVLTVGRTGGISLRPQPHNGRRAAPAPVCAARPPGKTRSGAKARRGRKYQGSRPSPAGGGPQNISFVAGGPGAPGAARLTQGPGRGPGSRRGTRRHRVNKTHILRSDKGPGRAAVERAWRSPGSSRGRAGRRSISVLCRSRVRCSF